MTAYRLWTPAETYRGTIEAETPARALLKLHRHDLTASPLAPELDYDPESDAIIWPDVLNSEFVERVGTGEWTLRLVVPENGGNNGA